MRNFARPLQVFLWSYVFVYAVLASLSITQVDIWWQLAEGQRILQTWTLPTQPAAAYGLPATPYFDEYAGYEVVLALLYHASGFVGLWLVFAAIYLAILFLPGAARSQKYPAFDLPSTFALLAAALLIRTRLEQRPEIVGGLLQVVLMVLLRGSSLEKLTPRLVVGLFVLFVAWTNTHSTFVFGLFTLGLWIASEMGTRSRHAALAALFRRGALLAIVAVAATMLNPYGPRRLLFPFLQASDPGSTALSPEMWSLSDVSPIVEFFFIAALVLLVWGIARTRHLPPWLIAFAVFAVAVSLKSFRFVDFTGIALLFIYAARDEQVAARPRWMPPWFLALPRDVALALLCLVVLLLDAFNLLANVTELRSELRLATHGLRYASDMAAYPVPPEGRRIPVLCGHGMGSYLSFRGNGNFRPLLDSGLAHFDDGSKRYFFFAWNEPEALALALGELHVDYVLIDWDTFTWIPTLHSLPGWQFVTCSPNGMIWKRSPGGPHPLSDEDRAQVSAAIQTQLQNGDLKGAFTYSTLLDQPADSLALLAKYSGPPWHDPLFNAASAWVDALPLEEAQKYFAAHLDAVSSLGGALIAARADPKALADFVAKHPDGSWYEKALLVEMMIDKGMRPQARTIFDSISPAPASSTTYYRLWRAVHGPNEPPPTAYGQWQTWDGNAKAFMMQMSARLNERIAELDRAAAR